MEAFCKAKGVSRTRDSHHSFDTLLHCCAQLHLIAGRTAPAHLLLTHHVLMDRRPRSGRLSQDNDGRECVKRSSIFLPWVLLEPGAQQGQHGALQVSSGPVLLLELRIQCETDSKDCRKAAVHLL